MLYQRQQERLALAWGWQPARIRFFVDAGLSGIAAAHRPAFLQMLEEIKTGRVRAVLATDQSRLARNAVEWIEFLRLCRIHSVVLAIDGRIVQTTDDGQAFSSSVVALVDEFENCKRRAAFEKGRLGKIASGRAISMPPTGYVARPDGSWVLDPDQEIQLGLTDVFRTFLAQRSAARTVQDLLARGRRIPRRKTGRDVVWVLPTVGAIRSIVSNDVYDGRYVYRRRRVDESRGRNRLGHSRVRVTSPDERLEIADHHPPYISKEQAKEIRSILKANAPAKNRRNLGPGCALLQGIVGCNKHDERGMGVDYRGRRQDGQLGPYYFHCHGDYVRGGPQCWVVPGRALDEAVARIVFQHVASPELEAIRSEWRAAKRDTACERSVESMELERARRQMEDLRKRYNAVDPGCRNLAETLEIELDEAIGRYNLLQATSSSSFEADLFTEEAFRELIGLCEDLPALFFAETTVDRDRKELLRVMIERVIVTDASRERISFTIRWVDGAPPTDGVAHLARHAHTLIKKMAAEGVGNPEIARRLNELGLKTTRGRHWTTSTVWQVQDYERRLARPGEKTSTYAAAASGQPPT